MHRHLKFALVFGFEGTCLTLTLRFFFFNDTATTEIYTLSLHDALPIYSERLDHVPRGRVSLTRESEVGAAGRSRRHVPRVKLEHRAHPELAEVPRTVVRPRAGKQRARVRAGPHIAHQWPQREAESRRQRHHHGGREQKLPLMHAVHAVGLRGVAPVAEAVESDELEPGGEHLDGEDRRRHPPPGLTLHGRAVSARAGAHLRGGGQARAWRQSAEPVPRVGEPGAEEQPDVWGVARAEERDSPLAPLRRGRLPGRRHGRRESRGYDGRERAEAAASD